MPSSDAKDIARKAEPGFPNINQRDDGAFSLFEIADVNEMYRITRTAPTVLPSCPASIKAKEGEANYTNPSIGFQPVIVRTISRGLLPMSMSA
jgi:hypothetical protein